MKEHKLQSDIITENFVSDIRTIIEQGRKQAYAAAGQAAIMTYWNIGRRIVEEEQNGEKRAAYGTKLIKNLADKLVQTYGSSYNKRNLDYYKKFYLLFPDSQIVHTCVHNLSWSHVRRVLSVPNNEARLWYLLGRGFAFVERQQHIATDTDDFYIDLVFYNYKMKRFVLFELKTHKLTHQDIGQLDMYIRMYDDLVKGLDDNPTIGVLLCTDTDNTIARYSVLHDSDQIFAAKYMTYMPTEDELRREIEQQKRFFLEQHGKTEA